MPAGASPCEGKGRHDGRNTLNLKQAALNQNPPLRDSD
ncbi:hypothetical protein D3OALGA1CA_1502 [Olavius algarvensis associated proteobacterium Delta 3]|nr:hypothetical protein D3OALGA1CA_1502 [Olavius algarvensis associated proteobacterium Delta 3]CAB5127205.1 hypothetical protein D3OALGB2SA_3365 [Olavius algarvensis associated proteobacterium Delta 3]